MDARFQYQTYQVRRKFLKIFGGSFYVYDPSGNLVLFSKQRAFRLREDIRIYGDESLSEEILTISTPQMIDFGATYTVNDSRTGEPVGALRRKGFRSLFRDEWALLDRLGREMGTIKEDSTFMALLRRIFVLIPQHFVGTVNGQEVCRFRGNFNPFIMKLSLDFTPDPSGVLDRRLGIAAAILICAIERKQSEGVAGLDVVDVLSPG